jgi:hypothetical protein
MIVNQPIEPIVRIIYALIETAIKKNISIRILLLFILSFCAMDINNPVKAIGEPITERNTIMPAELETPPPVIKKIGPRM